MPYTIGDPFTGNDGLATFNSTPYQILQWSLNRSATPRDVSDGDDEAIKRVAGKYIDASGSLSILMKAGTALPAINTKATLKLDIDTANSKYWTGSAILTTHNVTLDHKGTEGVVVQIDFVGNGDFTLTDSQVPV